MHLHATPFACFVVNSSVTNLEIACVFFSKYFLNPNIYYRAIKIKSNTLMCLQRPYRKLPSDNAPCPSLWGSVYYDRSMFLHGRSLLIYELSIYIIPRMKRMYTCYALVCNNFLI